MGPDSYIGPSDFRKAGQLPPRIQTRVSGGCFPTNGANAPRMPPMSTLMTYRSEEHTSEHQSPCNLVCRLLLEKTKPFRNRMLKGEVLCTEAQNSSKVPPTEGIEKCLNQPHVLLLALFFLMIRRPRRSTPFPYATFFR